MRKLWSESLPPIVKRNFALRYSSPSTASQVHFSGDYESWAAAAAASTGYDQPLILEKVRSAALAVKHGEAAFERDSVVFQRPEIAWQILASLLWSACKHEGCMSVLDFGGSLGSIYFQHRIFLRELNRIVWAVVEQPEFASVGTREIAEDGLMFFNSVESALAVVEPDVLLLSSVLQYLPDPHAVLESLLMYPWRAVIVDRTAFLSDRITDRLTVQKTPRWIYEASYPAWFFSAQSLLAHFEGKYSEVARWLCEDSYELDHDATQFLGFLFSANYVDER